MADLNTKVDVGKNGAGETALRPAGDGRTLRLVSGESIPSQRRPL